jgi:hypothetical protein
MYCVRLMRQPNHPCGWCHRADRPRVIPGPFYLCCCCCCCGEPGSGTWHLVLPVAMPFHASTHPGTYTHTHTQEQRTGLPMLPVQRMCISRTTDLPSPMQPMMARRGVPSSGQVLCVAEWRQQDVIPRFQVPQLSHGRTRISQDQRSHQP